MKTIKKCILLSAFPFLVPLTAFAESDKQTEVISPIPGTQVSAASWRASQVMGVNVKNSSGEKIGDIEDLVLDMKEGKIIAAIISSGGFLGIADTLSAVPVTALRYDEESKAFKTRLTKEQLGKAPQFTKDAWPDYSEATSIEALRSYRDSIGGDVTQPDNSAQNEKEIRNNAVDPIDQGNSAKDIQITQDIRLAIMNSEMSFNAKNIKIITRDENVSLKGVVESDAEHQAILKIASIYANTDKITDALKVNPK